MEFFINNPAALQLLGFLVGIVTLITVSFTVWWPQIRNRPQPVVVKVKKTHPSACLPTGATAGAAAFDIRCVIDLTPDWVIDHGGTKQGALLDKGKSSVFRTGLAFEIPDGHVMLIFSRSGHGFKHGVRLANSVAVIDSDYRGEVSLCLRNDGDKNLAIEHGDRIAQALIIPIPAVNFTLTDVISDTERGERGLGSTGDA